MELEPFVHIICTGILIAVISVMYNAIRSHIDDITHPKCMHCGVKTDYVTTVHYKNKILKLPQCENCYEKRRGIEDEG